MDTSDLAKRMKEYEKAGQRYLTRRTPILLRLDGSHFHTFTKNFKRPFDDVLIKTMQETAKFLCENIMGLQSHIQKVMKSRYFLLIIKK